MAELFNNAQVVIPEAAIQDVYQASQERIALA